MKIGIILDEHPAELLISFQLNALGKRSNTKNIDEARLRRDVLNKDLEEQWGRLAFYGKKSIRTRSGEDNYQLARARCELAGHYYQSMWLCHVNASFHTMR